MLILWSFMNYSFQDILWGFWMLISWGLCCPRFVNVHFMTIVNIHFASRVTFSYSLLAIWCPLLLNIGCSMWTIACHHLLFLPITYHCSFPSLIIVVCHQLLPLFVITRYCCLKFFASCHWWLLHAIVKGPCAFATPFP